MTVGLRQILFFYFYTLKEASRCSTIMCMSENAIIFAEVTAESIRGVSELALRHNVPRPCSPQTEKHTPLSYLTPTHQVKPIPNLAGLVVERT